MSVGRDCGSSLYRINTPAWGFRRCSQIDEAIDGVVKTDLSGQLLRKNKSSSVTGYQAVGIFPIGALRMRQMAYRQYLWHGDWTTWASKNHPFRGWYRGWLVGVRELVTL